MKPTKTTKKFHVFIFSNGIVVKVPITFKPMDIHIDCTLLGPITTTKGKK